MTSHKPPWNTKKGKPFPENHHIIPSSRGGGNETKNILVDIPSDLHWAWHRVFGNLTPMEILTTLARVFFKGRRFRQYKYSIDRQAGKSSLPPKMSPDEIILALERQVFPKDWVPSDKLMRRLERLRVSRYRES